MISPVPGGSKVDRASLVSKVVKLTDAEWAKLTALEIDPTADNLGLPPMVMSWSRKRSLM